MLAKPPDMKASKPASESRDLVRVMSGYVIATALFWLAYLLNSTQHWVSRGTLLTIAIGLGLLMCLGGVLAALVSRRRLCKI